METNTVRIPPGLVVAPQLPDLLSPVKIRRGVIGFLRNHPTVAIGGALLICLVLVGIFAPYLWTVDPTTMEIIDQITLPAFAGARPTITTYGGVDYVYLLEKTSNAVRYSVTDGQLTLDTSWTPAAVPYPDQTTGASLIAFGDWIIGATNPA